MKIRNLIITKDYLKYIQHMRIFNGYKYFYLGIVNGYDNKFLKKELIYVIEKYLKFEYEYYYNRCHYDLYQGIIIISPEEFFYLECKLHNGSLSIPVEIPNEYTL